MARKLRVEYPGAVYHLMNRGDRREEIFRDDVDRERLFGEYHIPKDSAAGRQQLEAALEARRAAEAGMDYKPLRRGWCLGSDAFREELLEQMTERLGAEHYGAERAATVEAHAEGIVAEELQRRRWGEADLSGRAKGDPEKLALAVRLRAETAVTVQWIAERLQMGAPGYLNHLLYRERNEKGE